MDIIKKGEFLFVAERVKNDKNGNPRFEILPIWLVDKPINFSYELSFLGYRVKKDRSRLIAKSYNMDDVINRMYEDCIVKSLIIKNVLTDKEVEKLESYARIDSIEDVERLDLENRICPNCQPLEVRYKDKVYTVYKK